jgi:uncharacterized paraquat-inducible protein A
MSKAKSKLSKDDRDELKPVNGLDRSTYYEAVIKAMTAQRQTVEQFLEIQKSSRSHMGTKHVCETCSTKYYDLNKSLECPKCPSNLESCASK